MLNGMGLMNPHADSSFIKSSVFDYVIFFFRYMMRTQPFLLWTWLWSAFVTMGYSVTEGLLPAMRDPLTIDARVNDIATRSNASPSVVWALRELHAHPAIFNPYKILRELWLDRAVLLGVIVVGSFQFFSFMHVFANVSLVWFIIPLLILMPLFLFYARSVSSELDQTQTAAFTRAPLSAQIVRVHRVAHGHIHKERHTSTEGVEYLNTGTWSPAYRDVECTQPYGRKCFAWIKPDPARGGERRAELYEWKESGMKLIEYS